MFQVYVVPDGTTSVKDPSNGVIANVEPVQIVVFTFAILIVGLTVIVTENGAPVQVTPPFVYVGVTV